MTRTEVLRAIAVAATIGLLVAASAAAARRYVGDDKIRIHTSGADFDGTVDWWADGVSPEPSLTGILELDNSAGTCARMRIDYLTSAGVLVSAKHGGEVCAGDNSKHRWDVDLAGYGNSKIGKVKVALERRNTGGGFTTIGSEAAPYPALSESFTITAAGLDFGGDDFAAGVPINKGRLNWNLAGGKFAPRLLGTLHINKAAGACGRMRLTYMTTSGTTLAREFGDTKCASDNSHHEFAINFGPFSDSRIGKVKVTLQSITANGSAVGLGSKTFAYGSAAR